MEEEPVVDATPDVPMVMEINCETGSISTRELTEAELADLSERVVLAQQAAQDALAKQAQAEASRLAIASWLSSRSDMTDDVRSAIASVMGVTLPVPSS